MTNDYDASVFRFSKIEDPSKWEDNSFACLNSEEAKKAERLISSEIKKSFKAGMLRAANILIEQEMDHAEVYAEAIKQEAMSGKKEG